MPAKKPSILVIGYGNPGRLDDGLGPAFADALSETGIQGITVQSDYQLTVEDASEVAAHDAAIFVDAHVSCREPFFLRRITPETGADFTSHSMSPEVVMGLAVKLFKAKTKGYVLGIRGYEFNAFGEALSEEAKLNLASALEFMKPALSSGTLEKTEASLDSCSNDTADVTNGDM